MIEFVTDNKTRNFPVRVFASVSNDPEGNLVLTLENAATGFSQNVLSITRGGVLRRILLTGESAEELKLQMESHMIAMEDGR